MIVRTNTVLTEETYLTEIAHGFSLTKSVWNEQTKRLFKLPNNFSFEWKQRLPIRDGHQKRILVADLSGLLWILLWSTLVYAVTFQFLGSSSLMRLSPCARRSRGCSEPCTQTWWPGWEGAPGKGLDSNYVHHKMGMINIDSPWFPVDRFTIVTCRRGPLSDVLGIHHSCHELPWGITITKNQLDRNKTKLSETTKIPIYIIIPSGKLTVHYWKWA
jgi:hypothetical protein